QSDVDPAKAAGAIATIGTNCASPWHSPIAAANRSPSLVTWPSLIRTPFRSPPPGWSYGPIGFPHGESQDTRIRCRGHVVMRGETPAGHFARPRRLRSRFQAGAQYATATQPLRYGRKDDHQVTIPPRPKRFPPPRHLATENHLHCPSRIPAGATQHEQL